MKKRREILSVADTVFKHFHGDEVLQPEVQAKLEKKPQINGAKGSKSE